MSTKEKMALPIRTSPAGLMPDCKNISTNEQSEQKKEHAWDIYKELQYIRGRACLTGFNRGEVIYPVRERRVKIANLGVPSKFEEEIFRKRGFTDEDMSSGITAILVYELPNPKAPHELMENGALRRYLNISGVGKVVEGNSSKPFSEARLGDIEQDALGTVAHLSKIPSRILDEFGSYDKFLEALGERDLTGIDKTEFKPLGIIYNGGLKQFVRALELREKGELGNLDTSFHELKGSLDDRGHFTKIFETLGKTQHLGKNGHEGK